MIRKTLLTLALLWMQAAALQAQVALTERTSARTDFELVAADSGAAVCYDAGDALRTPWPGRSTSRIA